MDNNKPVWAIIPASGIGQRMGSERPKQYLSFCGKTIIEHTLDRLLNCAYIHGAIVVLRDKDPYWPKIDYQPTKPLHTAVGGEERQDSVINGLSLLNDLFDGAYALVHDAVRPLVPENDLVRLIGTAGYDASGAILASPVADTIKRQYQAAQIAHTVDRSGLWRAFTPQLFDAERLLQALEKARANNQNFTDDAAAMEALGYRPLLVEGSIENIKITRSDDLRLAELIWESQQKS